MNDEQIKLAKLIIESVRKCNVTMLEAVAVVKHLELDFQGTALPNCDAVLERINDLEKFFKGSKKS